MTNSKIILFNSPKSLGKDSAIDYLVDWKGIPLVRREAKGKLHTLVQEFFCVSPERYWEIYEDREVKEKPLSEFTIVLSITERYILEALIGESLHKRKLQGKAIGNVFDNAYLYQLSIREAMIYISEIICKSRFGEDYFGVARAKSIQEGEIAVDSSTGFIEELPPLIEQLGQENILLIRVHREGATFEGDSRSYIPDGVITNTVDVNSVYSNIAEYLDEVKDIVIKFLGE
jgi:hypothetical protein